MTAFMLVYIYDSFSESVHFAVFVCGCSYACVCLSLRLCMHTGGDASVMVSLYLSVYVGGWDFCQHDPFAWSRLNLSCWNQTAVKNPDDSVFSFLASATHVWLHNYFFPFLSSLLHHWCGSAGEAQGQIQFLDDHGSLSLNLADSIKSSK